MNIAEVRKRVLPLVIVIALAAGGWYWWTTRGSGTTGASDVLGGNGTIEAEQVAVTPQTTGRIVEMTGDEGTSVKRGDVLYRLDDTLLKLQIETANAGVNAAQANYDHVKKDSGSNSAERAAARAQLDQAKIALKMAKVQLGYATVKSPLDGVISSVAAQPGENAVPGTTLVTVSAVSSLTVTIFVPESMIGQVKLGQTGVLTTDSVDRDYAAKVVFVATQAEFAPSTLETKDQRVKLVYQVKLRITDADESLKPGMPADVVLR
ncbi:MAG: hypothetical protein CVT67_05850 [Actinobacteria bacterium HGW-Actinobacteria-7]|nr:MAG: hypothetical protein CVT67_05850 [Actinobacteria bacterium HGW-Actinobacteria-7]